MRAGRRSRPRSPSSAWTARVSCRSPRCAARRSCSTSGLPGAVRARRRRRSCRPPRSGGRKGVAFVGIDVKDFRGDARLSRPLRRHLSERLRRQGLHRRALRCDRVPGDVLRRRAGPARHSDRRSRRGRGGDRRRDRASSRADVRAIAVAVAVILAASAAASEERPTASELESGSSARCARRRSTRRTPRSRSG